MELENGAVVDKLDSCVFYNYPKSMSSPLYIEHAALLKEAGVITRPFSEFENTLTKDDVLVIIDLQNDFFPEGTVEDGGRFGVAVALFILS